MHRGVLDLSHVLIAILLFRDEIGRDIQNVLVRRRSIRKVIIRRYHTSMDVSNLGKERWTTSEWQK